MTAALRLAVLAVLLGLLQGSSAFSWKACADVSSQGKINNVTLSPDPPYPGSTAVFIVEAIAGAQQRTFGTGLLCLSCGALLHAVYEYAIKPAHLLRLHSHLDVCHTCTASKGGLTCMYPCRHWA